MSKKSNEQIKSLAKKAKERLKNGFWEDYKESVQKTVKIAKEEGESTSNVISYYKNKAVRQVSAPDERMEELYQRVKYILDVYGDVSDMIGRLCDEEYMQTLSFNERQKYIFELAERYRACRERYELEKKYALVERRA